MRGPPCRASTAAGDLACVHNHMIGAFVYGELAGEHAAGNSADLPAPQHLQRIRIADAHD